MTINARKILIENGLPVSLFGKAAVGLVELSRPVRKRGCDESEADRGEHGYSIERRDALDYFNIQE